MFYTLVFSENLAPGDILFNSALRMIHLKYLIIPLNSTFNISLVVF